MSWYSNWKTSDSHVGHYHDEEYGSWSPSRSVSSFFSWGSGDSSYVPKTDNKEKMSDILAELNRSANMLSNSQSDGQEKSIRVRFAGVDSEGKSIKEGFNKNSFIISPDLMLNHKSVKTGEDYYNSLDALHGRVILGTQIRKNVTHEDFNNFSRSDDEQSKQTFQTLQEAIAHGQISKDWVGFQPYLDRHAQVTHAKKSEFAIPNNLTAEEFDSIINAANYNLLNPDDPIISPNQKVNDVISEFNDKLDSNWESCVNAVNWLREQLGVEPTSMGGSDGDGEGDGEDDGDGSGESAGDDKSEKDSSKPPTSKPAGSKPMDKDLLSDKPIESESKEYGDLTGTESDMLEVTDLKIRERTLKQIESRFGTNKKDAQEMYTKIVKSRSKSIKEIEKCFLFQENVCSIYTHGLTSGELDEHAFTKIHRGEYDTIYEQKDTPKQTKHCLGILLDQSGSMRGDTIKNARQVVIMLLEGLKAYKSITPIVYGHSGQETDHNYVDMYPYVTEKQDNRCFLSVAPAIMQNIDGMAIAHIAKQMQKVVEADHRYLLVISDGHPEGYGYSGTAAIKHTRAAVDRAAKSGVKVFGIGINHAFSETTGSSLYGPGNFCVLNDTASSLKVMTKKLKTFLTRH